jgi:hypothetical protein
LILINDRIVSRSANTGTSLTAWGQQLPSPER